MKKTKPGKTKKTNFFKMIWDKFCSILNDKYQIHKNRHIANIEYHKRLSGLKISEKINLTEMISDLRYFRPGFFNRLKARVSAGNTCLCLIHYPGTNDIVRYFSMPKPFILDINGVWYMFSPRAFRYINGMAKLEFYANVPFAIVHDVTDKYKPPSLDGDAFKSVMQSKHIQDASKVTEEKNMNFIQVIMAILMLLLFILNIINLAFVIQLGKKVAGLE